MTFRQFLKLVGENKTTHRLNCFLADLAGGGLSLGSWWLSYLLLTSSRFAGWRLSCWLLGLAGLPASSWTLRRGRTRRSLGCRLGSCGDRSRRRGLLLNYWLCLCLDVSLRHWWHDCSCCCRCLCSGSWGWLHWLSHKQKITIAS